MNIVKKNQNTHFKSLRVASLISQLCLLTMGTAQTDEGYLELTVKLPKVQDMIEKRMY